jgi:hypothetical protein
MSKRWAIAGLAVFALVLVWATWPSDWTRENHSDLASAEDLIATGALPAGLPPQSRNIAVQFNRDTGEAFAQISMPIDIAAAFRAPLIPVGRPTAVALAMRHPANMPDWDEVTLSARLRTGVTDLRRMRDGSRWYFAFNDAGLIRLWHAPDVEPAPIR